jgi:hypothetical protein
VLVISFGRQLLQRLSNSEITLFRLLYTGIIDKKRAIHTSDEIREHKRVRGH